MPQPHRLQLMGGSWCIPGAAEDGPGVLAAQAEPGQPARSKDGQRRWVLRALLLAGCSHPALPLSLLLGERHLAVDCNFIMSQVPNMPLANKRQSRAAIYFFFPPVKQTFPSVFNGVVCVAGFQVLNLVGAEPHEFLHSLVILEQIMCVVLLVKGFLPSSPRPGIWGSRACRACNTLGLSECLF